FGWSALAEGLLHPGRNDRPCAKTSPSNGTLPRPSEVSMALKAWLSKFVHRQPTRRNPRLGGRRRLTLEALQDRTVPSAIPVTTAKDEDDGSINPSLGTGISLREAINFANSQTGPQTIDFSSALTASGPVTIALGMVGDTTAGPSALGIGGDVTIVGPTDNG